MNQRSKEMKDFVLLSIFVAIILLLALIPQIGYVTILPGVSITLVHIPVLIGVFTFRRLREALVLGFAFGISSFIASLIYAASPFDLAFQLPWIAIIPRVLFAVAAYYLIVLFDKANQLKYGKLVTFILVSLITSLGIFFGLRATVNNVVNSQVNNTNAQISLNETIVINQELEITQNNADIITNALQIIYLNGQLNDDKYLPSTHAHINALIDSYEDDSNTKALSNDSLEANNDERKATIISLRDDLVVYKANLTSRTNTGNIILYILSAVLIFGFIGLYFVYTYRKKDNPIYIPSSFIVATFIHTLLVILTVAIFSPAAFTQTFGNSNSAIYWMYTLAATNGLIEALAAMFVGAPIVLALTNLRSEEEGEEI